MSLFRTIAGQEEGAGEGEDGRGVALPAVMLFQSQRFDLYRYNPSAATAATASGSGGNGGGDAAGGDGGSTSGLRGSGAGGGATRRKGVALTAADGSGLAEWLTLFWRQGVDPLFKTQAGFPPVLQPFREVQQVRRFIARCLSLCSPHRCYCQQPAEKRPLLS
eukprot:COSAG06_NODE_10860_length_1606_cov_1.476443_2_plen_163_part_00